MQIATTRSHYAPVRVDTVQSTDDLKCWGNEELSFTADGNAKEFGYFEDSLAVSYKPKHTLTTSSSNHTLWYSPKGLKNLDPSKNLHMNVYSKFFHNCQNFVTNQDVLQKVSK